MINLSNVNFNYKEIHALKDINLRIQKGEAVALIGPNGSGKSTFLKLINGIVFPMQGVYSFEGKEINENTLQDSKFSKLFHKKIGFVFQNSETQLFCSTVYEEIAFGPRQMGLKEQEIDLRVNDCLKLLNIEELKDRTPYNLSGGEKKRVAIASVLSLNPEVLVLDEPMNGLDPKTKRFLRELLLKLNAAGKTLICSTHDFEYVEGVFKRAIVFSKEHSVIRDEDYKAVINDEEFLTANNIK
ncbi:energy-coupling factor ABC transporter ATP-binding protein [Clostridium swellfunianum]|uniref:energy-coupling factor ABC transporter ATP-binding protein n=1 Tax=Clostridium swellfunianum TaxID=1367462 RepID=UPI00202F3A62|nr:ABC transporter ATP-binding protein [Clostridium swellfunianum]MCM0650952.1 energy-coupling factor ABC transporter ATP-binding protein [Clostridium swellfunianum]